MSKKQDYKIFLDGSKVVLNYSGNSDFTTLGIDLADWSGQWVLYCSSDHTSGTPTVTLQISDDNADWFDYQTESTDIEIPNWFYDDKMVHRYFRIVYTANSSNGNVSFKFVQND